MKIRIEFPGGQVAVFDIKLKKDMTVEDIAEEIASEMCSRIPTIKNFEACTEAHMRWLIPHIISEILETMFGGLEI